LRYKPGYGTFRPEIANPTMTAKNGNARRISNGTSANVRLGIAEDFGNYYKRF